MKLLTPFNHMASFHQTNQIIHKLIKQLVNTQKPHR